MSKVAGKSNPAVTVLAGPLEHPEGPDTLENGDIVMVETWTGKIKIYQAGKGLSDHAVTHGGPNACVVGSDGCIYVTQNGGRWNKWTADRLSPPGIQRISPDGRIETIIDSVDGIECGAPNDLCFGADGRLYFTDPVGWPGKVDSRRRHIFAVASNGKGEVIAELGEVFPNGIAADLQGGVVWGETISRYIKRKRPGQEIEILARLPESHMADGMKFDSSGRLWITTVKGGGFDVLDPQTGKMEFVECPHYPLNCVFAGESLIVTDRGLWDDSLPDVARNGRLVELHVGITGQPLFRGSL
jgi:gluconolactonase